MTKRFTGAQVASIPLARRNYLRFLIFRQKLADQRRYRRNERALRLGFSRVRAVWSGGEVRVGSESLRRRTRRYLTILMPKHENEAQVRGHAEMVLFQEEIDRGCC